MIDNDKTIVHSHDSSEGTAEENTLAEELESLYQNVSEEESAVFDDSVDRRETPGEPPSPPGDHTPRFRDSLSTKRPGNRILIFSLCILAVVMLAGITWHHIFPGDIASDTYVRRAAPATYRAPITASVPEEVPFVPERDLVKPARMMDEFPAEKAEIPVAVPDAAEKTAEKPAAVPDVSEKTAPAPEPAGGFTIQVASFPTEAEAKERAASFRADGMDTSLEKAVLESGAVWHRVIVGRFETRDAADAYLETIRARRSCDDCFSRALPAS